MKGQQERAFVYGALLFSDLRSTPVSAPPTIPGVIVFRLS